MVLDHLRAGDWCSSAFLREQTGAVDVPKLISTLKQDGYSIADRSTGHVKSYRLVVKDKTIPTCVSCGCLYNQAIFGCDEHLRYLKR